MDRPEFALGDILVKIGECPPFKYVVWERVQNGPTISLAMLYFNGMWVQGGGPMLTPRQQRNYVKVGRWSGEIKVDRHGIQHPSRYGKEIEDD